MSFKNAQLRDKKKIDWGITQKLTNERKARKMGKNPIIITGIFRPLLWHSTDIPIN